MFILKRSNLVNEDVCLWSHIINDPQVWHKFTILHANWDDRFLLVEDLLNLAPTQHIVPYQISRVDLGIQFFMRQCPLLIRTLLRSQLQFESRNETFSVEIHLRFAAERWYSRFQDDFMKVLQQRMDLDKKVLNLNRFQFDNNLTQYYPLTDNTIFMRVLQVSKVHNPTDILLRGNKLKNISLLSAVKDLNITCLDLGSNLIANIKDLEPLRPFKLVSLTLDDNPISARFTTADSYIRNLKQLIPTLTHIDGINISDYQFRNLNPIHLCVIDDVAQGFVNIFLKKFFGAFDTNNRNNLGNLYHHCAVLSVTGNYVNPENNAWLFGKDNNSILIGQKTISGLYKRWPLTQHEYYRFKVNLMLYKPDTIVIVVNGRCREILENRIEILHTNYLSQDSSGEPFVNCVDYTPVDTQKNSAIHLIQGITRMNEHWCRRYLMLHDFCISTTIKAVLKDCKTGIIPKIAFEGSDISLKALEQVHQSTSSTIGQEHVSVSNGGKQDKAVIDATLSADPRLEERILAMMNKTTKQDVQKPKKKFRKVRRSNTDPTDGPLKKRIRLKGGGRMLVTIPAGKFSVMVEVQ